jgi:TatD DNase family protein
MIWFDAHCHLPGGQNVAQRSVINGTSQEDWLKCIAAAEKDPDLIPAIGLHPWRINDAPKDWQAQFLDLIERAGVVGEIGLDQWVEGHDMERQTTAFCWQLKQAADRNLPVSIHCLKAGDRLLRLLKENAVPERGVHLHAFSGSAEEASQFAELGAYFSFHAGQFKANAKKAPDAARLIPMERLLIETDAPDTLDDGASYADFLKAAYSTVAKLRAVPLESLADQIAENFKRYFLND